MTTCVSYQYFFELSNTWRQSSRKFLLAWTLWLAFAWQGPLWAIVPPDSRTQHARAEALPESAFIPANWYWTMSLLIPGLSQMLMEEPEQGLVFFLGFASSIALAPVTVSVFTVQNQPEGANLTVANVLAGIFAVITVGFYVGNVLDAYFLNQDKLRASTQTVEKLPPLPARFQIGLHSQGIVSVDYALSQF